MKRLVLIDGKSVFYRGYYAMGNLALADGTPTGGVYGFAAIAMEIVNKLNPTKIVVAWDSKSSVVKRRAIFPEYKAGRVKPGEDFYAQIPLLKQLVMDLGWGFVEVDEFEADDIIGSLARQADEVLDAEGKCEYETFIISSDLDMLQIVDENTRMWRILKGFSDIQEMDVAEVEAKYGILKNQFLDLKALKGDASDNIPGVPGIGEKTAAKLLKDFGSLEGIYENINKISGTVQKKLAEGKDSAYMSRELARIMFDAPVSLTNIPDFKFDANKIVDGLKKLEFNSLIRKFKNNNIQEENKINNNEIQTQKDIIISWDVKKLMHENEAVANEILHGKKFWDLGQAAFLINPLARENEGNYNEQLKQLKEQPKLLKVLEELDLPLIPVLYKMEKRGMLIDENYFENLRQEYEAEVKAKEQEIWKLAGREFNVNSPAQLAEILFNVLKLPTKGIKKTQRGYSTGAKELEKLKNAHPIVPKLKEYREAAKLLSTYIVPMPELADEAGRIHTTFTQNVTATGRLSSRDPNLQNIPVRTDEGKRIRTGFVAGPGRVLVSADYSQFELRLAAVLAGDSNLIDDFNQNVDVHTKTAAEAFHVPIEQVTKQQRRAAKVINFGVLYGMSTQGLADAAGMSFGEAKEFIKNYFELRKPIKKYLEEILLKARTKGYVETYYGRKRPTPDVRSANFVVRAAAERAAQNMPIQGTEADLMKRAMINLDAALPEGAELLMQVHDSLIVECEESLATQVAQILKDTMEKVAPELIVRLSVETTVGKNWGEL